MEDGSAQSLIDFRIIKINRIEWMHIFFSSTYVSIQFKYKCSLFLVGYLVIHALEIGSGCEKSDENTCIYRRRGRLIKLLFSSLDVYIRKRKRLQLALSFFLSGSVDHALIPLLTVALIKWVVCCVLSMCSLLQSAREWSRYIRKEKPHVGKFAKRSTHTEAFMFENRGNEWNLFRQWLRENVSYFTKKLS